MYIYIRTYARTFVIKIRSRKSIRRENCLRASRRNQHRTRSQLAPDACCRLSPAAWKPSFRVTQVIYLLTREGKRHRPKKMFWPRKEAVLASLSRPSNHARVGKSTEPEKSLIRKRCQTANPGPGKH